MIDTKKAGILNRANHTGTQPIDTVEGLNPQAAIRLSRSLQRVGDYDQTLHADFAYNAYGLGSPLSCGVDNALEGEELFTVERATPKWVFGPNGKLREVPPNTIARQWRNGVPQGVLIEESRTNLVLWSEDFTNGTWGSQDLTVSSDVSEAPDGSATADKLTEETGTSVKFTRQGVGTWADNTVLSFSLFVRASEITQIRVAIREKSGIYRGAIFDLVTEESVSPDSGIRSYSIKRVSNGWFRISVTHDIGTHSNNSAAAGIVYLAKDGNTTYSGDGASGIYIWGAQLEEGSSPSSYIPTEDAPVTRAADNVSRELGAEWTPESFTIIADINVPKDATGISSILSLNSTGLTDDRFVWEFSGGYRLRFGGNFPGNFPPLSSSALTEGYHRCALVFSGDYMALYADGVKTGENTGDYSELTSHVGNTPTMFVGNNSVDAYYSNAEHVSINIIPRALSETELIELTS